MITRFRVAGFKSCEDAQAPLGALTVVLGPLGSGRTNLLEAMALLGRLATVERLERAFAPPNRGRAGECLRRGELLLDTDLHLNPRIPKALNTHLAEREKLEGLDGSFTRVAEKRMRYQVRLDRSPDSGALSLGDETLRPLTAGGVPRRGRKAFFERDDAHGRFLVRLERQGRLRYFGLGRRRTLLSEVTDLVYHPHPAAAREELVGIRRYAFESSALRAAAPALPADGPGFRGEDFPGFLARLASEEPDALRRVEERLAAVGLEQVALDGASQALQLRLRGEQVPLHLAPGGLLRLMAVTSLLESSLAPTVALFDEPEAGLDPAALAALARVFRAAATGRRPTSQVVVVTASADLASHLEPATILACHQAPGRGTVLEPLGGAADDLFRRAALERALAGLEPTVPRPAVTRVPSRRRRRTPS